MNMIDTYSQTRLSPDEKRELEVLLANNFLVLKKVADENNFRSVRALRNAFKSGEITMIYNIAGKRAMLKMIELEPVVIACYIKMAVAVIKCISRTNYNRPGVTHSDYLQQCAESIYDSMYEYNGSHKFSTFVRSVMQRRVLDFVRKEDRQSSIAKTIRLLRVLVNKSMKSRGLSFDEAIDILRKTEGVDEVMVEKLRHSLPKVENKDVFGDIDRDLLMLAIQKSPLNQIQRKAIDGIMSGEKGWRKKFRKHNLKTSGDMLSRQRIGQICAEACKIVREVYELMIQKKAA